ncbi:hypothetical protein, conserved [Plasmodium gonderi]|uniref:Inner membrane complex protein 1l n=1 Tax=Plasmodium gonderi TaxID=77519 RepID=A0A1Y1JKJ6_PLAGO|nr:hypothetical protein, conserved [Plasmodium gonderi]GAW83046.1 hypothetical protein, conserved [Plasmodium gonderi]
MEFRCKRLGLIPPQTIVFPKPGYNEQLGSLVYPSNVGGNCCSSTIARKRHISASPFVSVPRCRIGHFQRHAEVPVFHKIPKIVEVPEVREITRFVDSVKVVDIPVEQVRIVPKLKIREVEKIRYVPGIVEYIDIEQEQIVHKPYTEIIEKIYEIPEIEDVEIEVPIYVPTPVGPPKDVHINVPLPYDVPQFCYKPHKQIDQGIRYPTFHRVINKDPNLYVEEELGGYSSDVDHSKKEKEEMNSSSYVKLGATCRERKNNNEYSKRGYCVNENNVDDQNIRDKHMNEELRCYYDYQKNNSHNEDENYSKHFSNYGYNNKGKGAAHNENNLDSSEPFEKYYYSYSAFNNYKGEYNQNDNHEDNKNYIYDNDFSNKDTCNKKNSAELIVKRSKNSYY